MFRNVLPKDAVFFDYFEKHIAITIEAAKELKTLSSAANESTMMTSIKRIKDLEHQLDTITHECIEELHKSFITPFERTDIFDLINRLDDIVDNIDGGISKIPLYEVHVIRPEVGEFADILVEATIEIEKALKMMRKMKKIDEIRAICRHIRELENKADIVYRKAISKLFKEGDAINIIKWKEILERIETATDRCDHVTQIIEGICIESA